MTYCTSCSGDKNQGDNLFTNLTSCSKCYHSCIKIKKKKKKVKREPRSKFLMCGVIIVLLIHLHQSDEKEFDVFLSCVWSPTSEVDGVLMLSSRSGPEAGEEGGPTCSVYVPGFHFSGNYTSKVH